MRVQVKGGVWVQSGGVRGAWPESRHGDGCGWEGEWLGGREEAGHICDCPTHTWRYGWRPAWRADAAVYPLAVAATSRLMVHEWPALRSAVHAMMAFMQRPPLLTGSVRCSRSSA